MTVADPLTRNCTVPLGSCDEFAVALLCVSIVAIRVTGVPLTTVVELAPTLVVVAAFPTIMTGVASVGGLKLLSPA
jgi:hypothetical protein